MMDVVCGIIGCEFVVNVGDNIYENVRLSIESVPMMIALAQRLNVPTMVAACTAYLGSHLEKHARLVLPM
ncbi:hypothetical protein WJX72_001398 [[Myrmecia] bisecta]|uniref:Uncharacterized protein n=1 Tax=[Myrmecia] bisecta TaxID=41462 RepID=A0AAW1NZW8_9CHLO